MEWKPISTAPKERDAQFLGWDGDSIEKTWEGWKDNGKPVYVFADYRRWEPTHWMPLPKPPPAEPTAPRP